MIKEQVPHSTAVHARLADLRALVQAHLDLADAELTRQCEQAIRNYDSYISSAAHFLDLTVQRS